MRACVHDRPRCVDTCNRQYVRVHVVGDVLPPLRMFAAPGEVGRPRVELLMDAVHELDDVLAEVDCAATHALVL